MNKRIRSVAVIAIILLVIFLLIPKAGTFLRVADTAKKSDAVIVLSGGTGRLPHGVSLFEKGYGTYFLISNAGEWTARVEDAVGMGVPEEAILPDFNADSTYTNATNTKKLMLQNGLKSAVVVTSEFHSRRSRYIFKKVYKGSGITLTFSPAKEPTFDLDHWWKTRAGVTEIPREYIKLAVYMVRY